MEEKDKELQKMQEEARLPVDSVEYFMQSYEKQAQVLYAGIRLPLFNHHKMGHWLDEVKKAQYFAEPWPYIDEPPISSIAKKRVSGFEGTIIPGEVTFGNIFNHLGIREDSMSRSLADKKFKKVTIECEDGTTYAGEIQSICGSPYHYDALSVEAIIKDKPIGAYGIEKVLFQNPATIVFWSDGTKTVVNCMDNVEIKTKTVNGKKATTRKPKKADTYSKESGLAMAIVKKWAGNNGNYNNIFREFIPEMAQEEKKRPEE